MSKSKGRRVAVIGAGLGGLSAAIGLASRGFEVDVFEKNERVGGKLNLMSRAGYTFDLGPSIIILPHLFRRVFERAGRRMEDYVHLDPVEPQWRSFFEDGTVVDLYSDRARMAEELAKLADGGAGYDEFLDYSRRLYEFSDETYFEGAADSPLDFLKGRNPFAALAAADPLSSVDGGVGRYVKNPYLRDILGFFVKYVGSSAYDAPAVLNLMPYAQLAFGLYYVRGGMYNLARAYEKLLADVGGRLHLRSETVEIVRRGRQVTGVRLADGTESPADLVVCNMEVIPAYRRLLGEDGLFVKTYDRIFEPAASGIVVHIGLDTTVPQLAHHDFFFSASPRGHFDQIHRQKVLPIDPTLYVVCPTRTNPAVAPPGCDLLKVLPHVPYRQDPPFTRGQYEALKERCYDKLERMGLPDLRRHIVVEDMLTPDDLERMYYSNRGSIYGVVSDRRKNLALKAPKKSSRYDGLYFVGGSVNPGGGTCMAVLCGQQVTDMVTRETGA